MSGMAPWVLVGKLPLQLLPKEEDKKLGWESGDSEFCFRCAKFERLTRVSSRSALWAVRLRARRSGERHQGCDNLNVSINPSLSEGKHA